MSDSADASRNKLRAGDSNAVDVALSSLSDEALALRMQQRDEDAFRLIYERYATLIRRVVFRILQDYAEADDAVQTVFWDVYRAIDRFDPVKGSLRGWLLQYAHHRALNQKKSLQLRGFYTAREIDNADELPTERRSLLSPEATQAVRQALSHLSDYQQLTLRMIFFEGKEMEDVAQHLGQTVPNIRHHYYRGMRKLRDVLGRKTST
jgi:RNA polymerase sigma-70 factor (ECF subfamily)